MITEVGSGYGRGRLDSPQTWAATTNDQSQWFKLTSLDGSRGPIRGVATKGREDYDQWVTRFKVSWLTAQGNWVFLQCSPSGPPAADCAFTGNTDRSTQVQTVFAQAVHTSAVRIHPWTWNEHASMRAGLLVPPTECSEEEEEEEEESYDDGSYAEIGPGYCSDFAYLLRL